MLEFRPWPKTPRLFKDVVVTEKIDGTNACVVVTEEGKVLAQSRTRMLSPVKFSDYGSDNHGFRAWVDAHADLLAPVLGPGYHYGEWWGGKINRGYGCAPNERYFSLFNADRWALLATEPMPELPALTVVPVLWRGPLDTARILDIASSLKEHGSIAKPGFSRPEGVCIYHTASRQVYKYPFDKATQADMELVS